MNNLLSKLGSAEAVRQRMRQKRVPKKTLGISIGERSLLVAEVLAGPRPSVIRLAEMPFGPGVTIQTPEKVGTQLAEFLQQQLIAARSAVFGLPARWIVAQQKEVPAVDEATMSNILRLQAEAEFSTELKDLVYDYAGGRNAAVGSSVLLVATPRKYIELCEAISTAAKLKIAAIMPSAMALGEMSSAKGKPDGLVLSVAAGGAEMTAQRETVPTAIRHLRAGGNASAAFMNELRRVVSTLPPDSRRDMLMWDDTGMSASAVGEQLGLLVKNADLPILGVDAAPAAANGQGRKFASAVSLALIGLSESEPSVNFANSRLAPPEARLIPLWALYGGSALLLLIVLIACAIWSLDSKKAHLADLQDRYARMADRIKDSTAFVEKVSFAQAWHGGDPRYLACARDLTAAMSEDSDTVATSLTLRDIPKPTNTITNANAKPFDPQTLVGTLVGKTSDQPHVQSLIERMRRNPAFQEPRNGGSDTSKAREVSFTIYFNYVFKPQTPPAAGGKK